VQRALGLSPGSILEGVDEQGRIVVKRAVRHSSSDLHAALFPGGHADSGQATSPADLKQGIREHLRKRHARR
jgi:hypothetical protein